MESFALAKMEILIYNFQNRKYNGKRMNPNIDPLALRIGQNIRDLRREQNITQKEIAGILNISAQQIHKYETGKNLIPLNYLAILQDKFDVSLDLWLSNYHYKSISYDKKLHFYAYKINRWLNN